MKFYKFDQSNPGGEYDDSMPYTLFVQADSEDSANAIAEQHGVYFDGITKGLDCECCNDRWYRTDDWQALEEAPEPEDGVRIIHASKLYKELS
jgi:hypothetical protein